MKSTIFVDTSAWLALVNKSDVFHRRAKEVRDELVKNKAKFLLTNLIIVEIANCLSRLPFRSAAIQLIESIEASKEIQVVEIDREIYDEAWKLYCGHEDKEWGLTDCASFVVMGRYGIKEAFCTDHHFEQAGFTILLKE